eukprot:TRINITY_DN1785_c0_g2_i1.p1 TRINITY_DN1785_c0_g2~~TRINITY_DN1785_c0_g2_i1.p1  ORF type:complete len:204 (-),score=10.49 TRINITY_DN1785_c0_g2_i1:655-1266(-)
METNQSVEELEIIVGRIKRLETSLEEHTKALGKHQLKISEDSKSLTLEVEQIRELGHSLVKTLSETLEDIVKSMVPELVRLTVKGFEENTKPIVEGNLARIAQMNAITTDALSQARSVISSCKRDLTIRRALLAAAFWLGSMATAGLVYYYFPQHIHQGYSDDFLKTYFVGKAVRDNFNNLTKNDQTLIQEHFDRLYYLGSKK